MVIISSFWKYSDAGEVGMRRNPESEKVFMDAALVSRAFENTCAVVYCNVGGERSEDFLGCSQVTMPFMGCVGRIDSSGEEIKVIDVDMGLVREAEGVYKIREDMKNDGWHYACGKP